MSKHTNMQFAAAILYSMIKINTTMHNINIIY